MAIAFVTAASSLTGNNTSAVVTRTSVTNNNIAIAAIVRAAGTIDVVPAGWTLIAAETFNTDDALAIYWHLTAAGDPTSWTFTLSTTMRWCTLNFEFSGVNITTPIDVSSHQPNASSVSCTAPGVDPNFLEDMLVFFGGAASTGSWTPPTDFTEPATNGDKAAAAAVTVGGSYKLLASGAATGDIVATLSGAAINAGILFGLRDASATPDSTGDTGTVSVGTATADGTTVTATAVTHIG